MKKKFGLILIAAIMAVLAFGAAFVPVFLEGFDKVFCVDGLNAFLSHFNFSGTIDILFLIPVVACGVAALFLILLVILVIVKKDPRYLAGIIFSVLAFAAGAFVISVPSVAEKAVDTYILYGAFGVALIACIIMLFGLLLTKKEQAEAEEPASEENNVAIEYEPEGAPQNYAEEPQSAEVSEKEAEPVEEEPKEEEPTSEEEPKKKKAPAKKAPAKKEPAAKPTKVLGKYEIFPEAGFFKYRLKANNGEILLVSNGYTTREGARAGIETLKKNVSEGNAKIITDKNGFSQFRIYTQNDSRLVVAGEFYSTSANAQKALQSAQRFYGNDRIVDLESISESEVREWKVNLPPVNESKNGKFEVFIEEESQKWQGRLIASNGAVLFVTSTYSSKNAVLSAFDNIKAKVADGDLSIYRDKQNRYQFRVVSENGSVILMGETYPSRDSAISASASVRNFIGNARIIDTSKSI